MICPASYGGRAGMTPDILLSRKDGFLPFGRYSHAAGGSLPGTGRISFYRSRVGISTPKISFYRSRVGQAFSPKYPSIGRTPPFKYPAIGRGWGSFPRKISF